jgi:hypothetical protein
MFSGGIFVKKIKSVLAIVMVLVIGVCLTGCKSDDYKAAVSLYDSGDYAAAVSAFAALGDYKDSADRAAEAKKVLNAEFSEWFTIGELAKTDGIASLTIRAVNSNLSNPEYATLKKGDNEYLCTTISINWSGTSKQKPDGTFDNSSMIYEYQFTFDYPDITDYDSVTVTGKDLNDEAVTITYYPNVE